MSFFQLSDGSQIEGSKEFDGGGGNIEPIPGGTVVLAAPSEAKWESKEGQQDYISLKWVVMLPEEYKNRIVFQKIQVNHEETKKADKAKRMLVAIDANAGGKLMAAGEEPTDESLQLALTNKMMSLSLEVWEIDTDKDTGETLPEGDRPRGNWVRAVADKTAAKAAANAAKAEGKPTATAPAARPANAQRQAAPAARTAAPRQAAQQAAKPEAAAQDFDSFDDDIPF